LRSDILELWLEKGEIRIEIGDEAPRVRLNGPTVATNLLKGQYNIRERGSALDLMVLNGQAIPNEATIRGRVEAGQTALVGNAQIQVRQSEPIALERAQAWRQGELVFAGESLDFVLIEYNRYLDHKIIVSDASLSRLRLGGRFTSEDPAEFLSALDASFGVIASKQSDGTVILVKRP
jgi:transmembrane sensor